MPRMYVNLGGVSLLFWAMFLVPFLCKSAKMASMVNTRVDGRSFSNKQQQQHVYDAVNVAIDSLCFGGSNCPPTEIMRSCFVSACSQ